MRLKDIGRAELGQKDYSIRSYYQGKPATTIAVYQQPGANALDVSKDVRETLRQMKKSFPEGLEYDITLDTTEFTRASIETVVHTFFEALVLVVLVVFLFLQSLRATLIPILAVPISIVGTAVGMTALGFSINMLTLFGMVLAIGIVVDDAIVVIEAVEHNMAKLGLAPKEAAKKAMDEVGGAARRDRAGAVRGVRAGRVRAGHHGTALQAVRDHHRDLGRALRRGRADAVAGAGRAAAEARPRREARLLQVVRERASPA